MITFEGITEEDLVLFQEHLHDKLLMKRAQAIVAQRQAARIARSTGGQRVTRGKHGQLLMRPTANIDPNYYFSRMGQEREANSHRLKTGENVWDDPDFLPFELKKNPHLRPVLDDQNAPVHMNGIVLPTAENFKAAKRQNQRSDRSDRSV